MSCIKICGLRRDADIDIVNKYKPDYAGFILVPGRTRNVELDTLKRLSGLLSKDIQSVGVFYDSQLDNIAKIADLQLLDVIQLHGHETERDVEWLKTRFEMPIIKAISVKSRLDIEAWQHSQCDYLLLDNGNGGTGERFDWNSIGTIEKPFFIAGGINADNILEALKYAPYGIDVSGGVESEGYKDEEKVNKIIAMVRREI